MVTPAQGPVVLLSKSVALHTCLLFAPRTWIHTVDRHPSSRTVTVQLVSTPSNFLVGGFP